VDAPGFLSAFGGNYTLRPELLPDVGVIPLAVEFGIGQHQPGRMNMKAEPQMEQPIRSRYEPQDCSKIQPFRLSPGELEKRWQRYCWLGAVQRGRQPIAFDRARSARWEPDQFRTHLRLAVKAVSCPGHFGAERAYYFGP
jgi:hypothetical protein